MDKNEFGLKVRYFRKKVGLSIKELAQRAHVSASLISMVENGARNPPKVETLVKLAEALNIGPFTLVDYAKEFVDVREKEPHSITRYIGSSFPTSSLFKRYKFIEAGMIEEMESGGLLPVPIFGSIRAGDPITMARENMVEYGWAERSVVHDHVAFFLRVVGHSMVGDQIYDGDRVLAICGIDYSSSDICVVAVGDEDATLKRVKCQGGICMLTPSNPSMEPMMYPANDVHVIGVVAEVRRLIKDI